MAFVTPALDDQTTFLVALYRNVMDDPDVSVGSFNWLWLRSMAGGVTDNHAHIEATKNDLLPDTSEGSLLDRWAKMLGVPRKSATPARKDNALRVFGVVAAAVPDASVMIHSSGLRFQTVGAAVIGALGYVDVGIVAIDVGSVTRLNAGEILEFDVTPANLEGSGELQLDLDEDGVDQESDGDLRARVLSRLSSPPLGGKQDDYVQWALETVGISTAFAYPLRAGYGSVDLAALHAGSGNARVLLAGEVIALQASVDALRPVGMKSFRALTVTTRAVDVEYLVLPDGAESTKFDWDDTLAPIVLLWTSGTRTLRFTADRPTSMKVGDRIIINSAGASGAESIIESFASTDSVVLEEVPAVAPVATDVVYAGGPLVALVRAAIQAMFDALGTANPDDHRYGTWDGNVRPGSIDRSARVIAGVLDGTVVAPAAIVEASDPDYPDDGTIELLIAGKLLVRKVH